MNVRSTKRLSPLRANLVKADDAQMKLFDELPDAVPCGCYDGGSVDWKNDKLSDSRPKQPTT